jgi:hypothetical protein
MYEELRREVKQNDMNDLLDGILRDRGVSAENDQLREKVAHRLLR